MSCVSAKELLLWKKEQLSKGGDKQSLRLLLETIGGISHQELNFLEVNYQGNLYLKKKFRIY